MRSMLLTRGSLGSQWEDVYSSGPSFFNLIICRQPHLPTYIIAQQLCNQQCEMKSQMVWGWFLLSWPWFLAGLPLSCLHPPGEGVG